MKKRNITLIFAAILSAAMLAGCTLSKAVDNPEFTTNSAGEQIITEDTAKRAAAEHAAIPMEELQYTRVILTRDDGCNEYEIEFYHNGYEYEYEISAKDGRVTDFDKDRADRDDIPVINDNKNEEIIPSDNSVADNSLPINSEAEISAPSADEVTQTPAESGAVEAPAEDVIGEDAALEKALEHAGLNKEDITVVYIGLDKDKGRMEYDIEFYCGNEEYDYEINAYNGTIDDFDKDYEYIPEPDKPSETVGEYISREKALEAALADAGVNKADALRVEIELDRDDSVVHYEIEFENGRYEYSYDINAIDGSIIKSEKDIDD